MNSFLWKGTAPDGGRRSERVAAENAQAAKAQLSAAGWTDLQLVMDELCDQAGRSVEAPEDFREIVEQRTADEVVRSFEGKEPGFWSQYAKALLDSKGTLLALLLLTGWGLFSGRRWPVVTGGLGLALMALLFPIISVVFSLPGQYYNRLNRAKVWSRWDEVLRCVERLRQIRRLIRVGPGDVELVRCRAQALAAQGRLEEGIREFSRFADDPNVAHWTYLSFLAGIYDNARAFDQALECRRAAAAEKPDTSVVWIDLAFGLVHGLNRPAEARQALARAEALEVTQLGLPYLDLLRGIIAWREGKPGEAQLHLEKAAPGFEPFLHSPLVEGLVLLTRSYLCAVLGAQGQLGEARRHFRHTEKFLAAARLDELLEACRRPLAGRR